MGEILQGLITCWLGWRVGVSERDHPTRGKKFFAWVDLKWLLIPDGLTKECKMRETNSRARMNDQVNWYGPYSKVVSVKCIL